MMQSVFKLIGSFASTILAALSIAAHLIFLAVGGPRRIEYLLKKYGTTATGKIIKFIKTQNQRDDEYHDYVIHYIYEKNGKEKIGKDKFSLNTDHISYANAGSMLGLPKLITTVENIEEGFQPGAPVFITYIGQIPYLSSIKYQKHPNELIDEQAIADYKKKKSAT